MRISQNMYRLYRALFILTLVCWLYGPHLAHADLEWLLKKQLNLQAQPLDVASSTDGQWVYVLTPGEVLVYSMSKGKVTDRIPVGKAFDRISHSLQNNTLMITSSTKKLLKIIQIEEIHQFAFAGSPFKGPKNAPVTIAVFSDYQ
ncbi:MAG TPA: hypothetical protein DCO77_03900 [Nitrospiraceae bacterium]|nr:hypothetical protein [Nitrospiraceae bacterium]